MVDGTFSVVDLKDSGDARGSSFSVPAELFAGPFPVADMHVATIEPGAIRGNHYHAVRREVLVIMAADRWSLHWDEGADDIRPPPEPATTADEPSNPHDHEVSLEY